MDNRRTKKNISSNSINLTKSKVKDRNKKESSATAATATISSHNDLIESLLSKGKKSKVEPMVNIKKVVTNKGSIKNRTNQVKPRQTKSKRDVIINNFHQAINSTKSDQIIVKMLELNESDIVNFYTNLEKMIGKDLSLQIRDQMSNDIKQNPKSQGSNSYALCPFCNENKSNCVILLCGHLICHRCGKNINRCKYPCPKCKKPIKYIQYIVD